MSTKKDFEVSDGAKCSRPAAAVKSDRSEAVMLVVE
jgi:hypothetical protein